MNRKLNIFESGALILLSGVIGGVIVSEIRCDHTKEICPITAFELGIVQNATDENFSHQKNQMQKEFAALKADVKDISYHSSYFEELIVQAIQPPLELEEDDKIYYAAPEGYTLTTDEMGNVICVMDTWAGRLTGPCFVTTFSPEIKENGLPNEDILRIK